MTKKNCGTHSGSTTFPWSTEELLSIWGNVYRGWMSFCFYMGSNMFGLVWQNKESSNPFSWWWWWLSIYNVLYGARLTLHFWRHCWFDTDIRKQKTFVPIYPRQDILQFNNKLYNPKFHQCTKTVNLLIIINYPNHNFLNFNFWI